MLDEIESGSGRLRGLYLRAASMQLRSDHLAAVRFIFDKRIETLRSSVSTSWGSTQPETRLSPCRRGGRLPDRAPPAACVLTQPRLYRCVQRDGRERSLSASYPTGA